MSQMATAEEVGENFPKPDNSSNNKTKDTLDNLIYSWL